MEALRRLGSDVRVFVVLGLAVVAGGFWALSGYEIGLAEEGYAARERGAALLTAMLDQETGLRGYRASGDVELLDVYAKGRRAFDDALADVRRAVGSDAADLEKLHALERVARRWQSSAGEAVRLIGAAGPEAVTSAQFRERSLLMDSFRARHAELMSQLAAHSAQQRSRGREVALVTMLAIVVLFGLVVLGTLRRRAAQQHVVRDRQREFADALQAAESEDEVRALLVRGVSRLLPPGSCAVVLNRNASDDRLEAVTPAPGPLEAALLGARPRSCLAVRRGRVTRQDPAADPLLRCELCAATGLHTACVPSLVGGNVIGAVLTASPTPLSEPALDEIEGAVEHVAPVLANLRTLAVAELRAHTDALTGLANRREGVAILHRMCAQALRTGLPLTAVMLDVDHFKRLNDEHGHEAGDEALAAVAAALRSRLRESDAAARWGGEEFLLLLPATEREGGVRLAEDVRETIERLAVASRSFRVTASLGVAELPSDAIDADGLVRAADQALYDAKRSGRNRVVAAEPPYLRELAEA
ncbi:MAG TPA: diguanylate cyclase [Gaiellaceae bacterium]|nr:diguanylate cyclase [Gaiellaceae bacterium]